MTFNPMLDRAKKRSTGHHGRKAETHLASRFSGRAQIGSGNMEGAKGDVKKETPAMDLLLENKSTVHATLSIKQEWLHKIYKEALDTNRTPALSFQFTTAEGGSSKRDRWVCIPEHLFAELVEMDGYKAGFK